MTSLRDVIAEALNAAYIDPGDDFASLRESYRHDGHVFNGACYVCRCDVSAMADAVRDALMANRWMQMVLVAKLREIADYYPEHIFTPGGTSSDAIAGTAIRERMLAEVRRLAEVSDD